MTNGDLRVGYVVKRYPRYSETFIVNEILAHEAAGLEVQIFALRPPNDTRFQDLISRVRAPVTYVPAGGGKASSLWSAIRQANGMLDGFLPRLEVAWGEDVRDLHQGIELACEARRRGLTNLHAHFGTVSTTVARLAGAFADLPYTFTAHAKDIFHEEVEADDLARKVRDAAAVVTVSDFNVAHLEREFRAVSPRIERVYNGMPLERFPYEDPGSRPPHVIAVGRLVEKKGFADLIEACALLAKDGHEFSCEIIGEGPVEADLRERIRAHGLEPMVELRGPQPQAVVIEAIREAAVMACPCVVGEDGNRDGLPTVLLESMALGTPCVSTDVTGIPEVIIDGETGVMVPQHDPAALARAIERVVADGALRTRMASRARSLIEKEFDAEQNAGRLRAIFERAVRGDLRGAPAAS